MACPTVRAILTLCLLTGIATISADARAADSPFDPARHMPLKDVKPGMKGYGLSVFKGTTPDRFDVEVVSILHNQLTIQADVILVRCKGANLEHTGAIAGMSGSPIYLTDETGKTRLAGAFAYGWPLAKDPVGGVQPIEYMLNMAEVEPATKPVDTRTSPVHSEQPAAASLTGARWNLAEARTLLAKVRTREPDLLPGALRPMLVPVMASGFDRRLLDTWNHTLGSAGLVALQAGGSGTTTRAGGRGPGLFPGSVMVVPILRGDAQLAAVGTCTEVLKDRVFGFGHPFSNDGPVMLPVGDGQVDMVVASLASSFKLGSMTNVLGTLFMDQQNGVAGRIGKAPALVPIEMDVRWTAGAGENRTFRFEAIQHPRITPLAAGMAMMAAVTGRKSLPRYHTLEFEMEARFTNGRVVKLNDISVNSETAPVSEMAQLLELVTGNPFDAVQVASVKGSVRILPESREATVLSVNVPKLACRPGDTIKAFVTVRPFRAAEKTLPIEMDIPRDLPAGTYRLSINDRDSYLEQEQMSKPFRFSAQSVDEIFGVLDDVTKLRSDALYVRLMRQSDGVAIGRVAMPGLPSSRRQILLGAGRSDTTPFVSSSTRIVPTGMAMSGSADFEITINKDGKGDGHGTARRPATRP